MILKSYLLTKLLFKTEWKEFFFYLVRSTWDFWPCHLRFSVLDLQKQSEGIVFILHFQLLPFLQACTQLQTSTHLTVEHCINQHLNPLHQSSRKGGAVHVGAMPCVLDAEQLGHSHHHLLGLCIIDVQALTSCWTSLNAESLVLFLSRSSHPDWSRKVKILWIYIQNEVNGLRVCIAEVWMWEWASMCSRGHCSNMTPAQIIGSHVQTPRRRPAPERRRGVCLISDRPTALLCLRDISKIYWRFVVTHGWKKLIYMKSRQKKICKIE